SSNDAKKATHSSFLWASDERTELCVAFFASLLLSASPCRSGAVDTAQCLGTLHPPIPRANGVSILDCWSGTRRLVRSSRRGRCSLTDSPHTCNCPSPRLQS